VERSSQEQARGGRRITESIESINNMVSELNTAQRDYSTGSENAILIMERMTEALRERRRAIHDAVSLTKKLVD
jgi:methyl-accepting chemotaxis protein